MVTGCTNKLLYCIGSFLQDRLQVKHRGILHLRQSQQTNASVINNLFIRLHEKWLQQSLSTSELQNPLLLVSLFLLLQKSLFSWFPHLQLFFTSFFFLLFRYLIPSILCRSGPVFFSSIFQHIQHKWISVSHQWLNHFSTLWGVILYLTLSVLCSPPAGAFKGRARSVADGSVWWL